MTYKRGEHPNSRKNLKSWKPGQSGNPNGRPKGNKYINKAVKDLLASREGKDKALVDALVRNLTKRILNLRKVREPYQ